LVINNIYDCVNFFKWKGAKNEISPRIWLTGLSSPSTEVAENAANLSITLYPSQSLYNSSDKLLIKAIEFSNNLGLNESVAFTRNLKGSYVKTIQVPVIENNELKAVSAKLTCSVQ
jgi:hypothetical protein